MSLILDALNRSRQEQGEVPGLETSHSVAADSRSPLLLWVLGAALAAALGVILWLLVHRDAAPAPPVSMSQPAPVPAPEPKPAPEPTPPPATTSEGAWTASAAQPEAAREQPEPEQPAPEQPVPEQPVPGQSVSEQPVPGQSVPEQPALDPEVGALYAGEAPVEPGAETPAAPAAQTGPDSQPDSEPAAAPAERDESVDIDAMVRRAENELENARLAEHPAPFISELSQQHKDAIPTLLYSAHDYSGRSGQSSVLINGKRLQKGGSPAPGVTVEEILPDSVVLSYRGTQFRLRALNSWVNL